MSFSLPMPPLAESAERQSAAKAFLVDGAGRALSYGLLAERIGRLAALFQARGLAPGERVALAVRDDADFAVCFLALLRCGLVAVPLSPDAPPREARAILAHAQVAGAIIDQAIAQAWTLEAEAFRLFLPVAPPAPTTLLAKLFKRPAATGEAAASYPQVLDAHAAVSPPTPPPPETPAYVLFTSGTTSRPKGVVVSHGALNAHLRTLAAQFGYDETSRLLNTLPPHHADGILHGAVIAYFTGATLYRPRGVALVELPALLDQVYAQRVTHLLAVPALLAMLLRIAEGREDSFRSPEFRAILSTASLLEPALWQELERTFQVRVANIYGLTETVCGSLFCGPDDGTRKLGTLGKPVDCEVRLIDARGREAAPGEVGEIQLRGPHLFSGYFRDEAATEAAFDQGWLRTGDLARCDAEGFYHFVGRSKTVIVRGGRNVYPEEVAEVLQAHSAVREAAVLGQPDALGEERVVACIVPALPFDREALEAHCRAKLSAYKVPSSFVVLDELPKGPSGKVRLEALRAQLESQAAPAEAEQAELAQTVIALAARTFQLPPQRLDMSAKAGTTLGWDSLAHMKFLVALETHHQLRFTPQEMLAIDSLEAAVEVLSRRLGAAP